MSETSTIVRFTPEDIDRQIAAGADQTRADAPEAGPLDADFWESAKVRMPVGKTSVHLRLDSDIFDWFKLQGDGHLTRMNAVLRAYVDAQTKSK